MYLPWNDFTTTGHLFMLDVLVLIFVENCSLTVVQRNLV